MTTKEARRVLREYHAAVKAVVAIDEQVAKANDKEQDALYVPLDHAVSEIRKMLPQADLAVKALVERFP